MNSRFAGRWAVAAAASAPAGVPAGGPVGAGAPMSGAGSPTSTGEIRSGCRGAGRTTTASEGPWPLHSSVPSSNATEIPRSSPSKGRGGFPHEHFTAGSPRASTGIEIPARSGAGKGTTFPFPWSCSSPRVSWRGRTGVGRSGHSGIPPVRRPGAVARAGRPPRGAVRHRSSRPASRIARRPVPPYRPGVFPRREPPRAGRDRTSASRPSPLCPSKNGAREATPAATSLASNKGVAESRPPTTGRINGRTAILRIAVFPAPCRNARSAITAPPGGFPRTLHATEGNCPFKGAGGGVNSVSACVQ